MNINNNKNKDDQSFLKKEDIKLEIDNYDSLQSKNQEMSFSLPKKEVKFQNQNNSKNTNKDNKKQGTYNLKTVTSSKKRKPEICYNLKMDTSSKEKQIEIKNYHKNTLSIDKKDDGGWLVLTLGAYVGIIFFSIYSSGRLIADLFNNKSGNPFLLRLFYAAMSLVAIILSFLSIILTLSTAKTRRDRIKALKTILNENNPKELEEFIKRCRTFYDSFKANPSFDDILKKMHFSLPENQMNYNPTNFIATLVPYIYGLLKEKKDVLNFLRLYVSTLGGMNLTEKEKESCIEEAYNKVIGSNISSILEEGGKLNLREEYMFWILEAINQNVLEQKNKTVPKFCAVCGTIITGGFLLSEAYDILVNQDSKEEKTYTPDKDTIISSEDPEYQKYVEGHPNEIIKITPEEQYEIDILHYLNNNDAANDLSKIAVQQGYEGGYLEKLKHENPDAYARYQRYNALTEEELSAITKDNQLYQTFGKDINYYDVQIKEYDEYLSKLKNYYPDIRMPQKPLNKKEMLDTLIKNGILPEGATEIPPGVMLRYNIKVDTNGNYISPYQTGLLSEGSYQKLTLPPLQDYPANVEFESSEITILANKYGLTKKDLERYYSPGDPSTSCILKSEELQLQNQNRQNFLNSIKQRGNNLTQSQLDNLAASNKIPQDELNDYLTVQPPVPGSNDEPKVNFDITGFEEKNVNRERFLNNAMEGQQVPDSQKPQGYGGQMTYQQLQELSNPNNQNKSDLEEQVYVTRLAEEAKGKNNLSQEELTKIQETAMKYPDNPKLTNAALELGLVKKIPVKSTGNEKTTVSQVFTIVQIEEKKIPTEPAPDAPKTPAASYVQVKNFKEETKSVKPDGVQAQNIVPLVAVPVLAAVGVAADDHSRGEVSTTVKKNKHKEGDKGELVFDSIQEYEIKKVKQPTEETKEGDGVLINSNKNSYNNYFTVKGKTTKDNKTLLTLEKPIDLNNESLDEIKDKHNEKNPRVQIEFEEEKIEQKPIKQKKPNMSMKLAPLKLNNSRHTKRSDQLYQPYNDTKLKKLSKKKTVYFQTKEKKQSKELQSLLLKNE